MNERARDIFGRCIEISPSRRMRFVERATRDDPALRAEVLSLLRAHERMGVFLAGDDSEPVAEQPCNADAVPGHRLLRKLGEGGFGRVYLARDLGELDREVAVKILRPGMMSPAAQRRFQDERRILAGLQHDGIARVYAAGSTADGAPWFSMEWVDGAPIDQHCDAMGSSIAERVDLVIAVCRAVAHAHQRGVIHGDLKPANVLVCTTDDVPRAKVIDFGIARSLGEPDAADRSLGGTPRYMSPEQKSGAPADTRSDVYALGLLLAELLCASPALGVRSASTSNLAISELLAGLPVRQYEALAKSRRTTVKKLRRALRGDLEAIVARATATEAEQRYASVAALIEELEAHRRDYPVRSRGHVGWHGFVRTLRRHRIAAGVIGVALVIVGAVQWRAMRSAADAASARAERSRAVARTDAWARAADAVVDFIDDVFFAASPDEKGADVRLVDALDHAESALDANFKGQPLSEARVLLTLGKLRSRLGDDAAAREHFDRAVALLEATEPADSPALAITRIYRAIPRQIDSVRKENVEALQRAVERLDPRRHGRTLTQAMRALGFAALRRGDNESARRWYDSALEVAYAGLAPGSIQRITTLVTLFEFESKFGSTDRAEKLLAQIDSESAAAGSELRQPLDHRRRLAAAEAALNAKRYDDAQSIAAAVLVELGEGALDRPNANRDRAHTLLGAVAQARRDYDAATEHFRIVLERRRAQFGASHDRSRNALSNLVAVTILAGNTREAETLLDELPEPAQDAPLDQTDLRLRMLRATIYSGTGRSEEAIEIHRELLERQRAALGPEQRATLRQQRRLAAALLSSGHPAEAVSILRDAVERSERASGETSPDSLAANSSLAFALAAIGQSEASMALAQRTLESAITGHGADHGCVTDTFRHSRRIAGRLRARDWFETQRQIVLDGLDAARARVAEGTPEADRLGVARRRIESIYALGLDPSRANR